jgi:beta-glucosidase
MQNRLRWLCLLIVTVISSGLVVAQGRPGAGPANSSLDAERMKRVSALILRMTPEQKAAQMQDHAPAIPQLKIPEYGWWNEGLHGVAYAGKATNFPQAIGLAASWDTDLLHDIGEVISTEARAKHNEALRRGSHARFYGLTFWAPNVNIFRDPRWGRGQETYGEDPVLTSKLAVSFVRGMQGDNPDYLRVIATPKHFAVHSGPEQQRHRFDVRPTPRDLADTYLPAFRAAVTEGHAGSIMCAYNAVDGMPACANQTLLNNFLRRSWNFQGYVVSDCGAIDDIFGGHKFTADASTAVAAAIKAGTDLDCGHMYRHIPEAVKQKLVTETEVDQALQRLLMARIRLGILDGAEQGPYTSIPIAELDSPRNRAMALRAARESIVLLKNAGNLLPLSPAIRKLAVIGPAADYLASTKGNYAGTPSEPVVPLSAMRKQWGDSNILYSQGSAFVDGALLPIPRNFLRPVDSPGREGLTGEYFNNNDFTGKPVLVRTDPSAGFDFVDVSPGPGVEAQTFAARWTTWFTPPTPGKYRIGIHLGFCYECRQLVGYRMYLDEKLVLDSAAMSTQDEQSDASVPVEFADGSRHLIRVEYTRSKSGGQIDIVWQPPSEALIQQAVGAAQQSDAVVAFVGLSTNLEGEQMKVDLPGFSGGDRTSLDLPAAQHTLLESIARTGKPLIVVLLNGSALSVNWAKEYADAIVEAWYPGEEGGTAIAETLAGQNNPGGRLPVTFYKGVSDLPPFDDYRMQGRTYRFYSGEPLFPFGFGLSYTKFSYLDIRLSSRRLKAGDSLVAKVLVKNSGSREGDEVVQFYTKQTTKGGSQRPALKSFARVRLKPGEERWISASLSPRDLSVVDDGGTRRVLRGTYVVYAGGCQFGSDCPAGKVAPYRITTSTALQP